MQIVNLLKNKEIKQFPITVENLFLKKDKKLKEIAFLISKTFNIREVNIVVNDDKNISPMSISYSTADMSRLFFSSDNINIDKKGNIELDKITIEIAKYSFDMFDNKQLTAFLLHEIGHTILSTDYIDVLKSVFFVPLSISLAFIPQLLFVRLVLVLVMGKFGVDLFLDSFDYYNEKKADSFPILLGYQESLLSGLMIIKKNFKKTEKNPFYKTLDYVKEFLTGSREDFIHNMLDREIKNVNSKSLKKELLEIKKELEEKKNV